MSETAHSTLYQSFCLLHNLQLFILGILEFFSILTSHSRVTYFFIVSFWMEEYTSQERFDIVEKKVHGSLIKINIGPDKDRLCT